MNGGGSESSGTASGVDFAPTDYVTSYDAADRWTSHCEHARNMLLLRLDPNMLIGFLCKTRADGLIVDAEW